MQKQYESAWSSPSETFRVRNTERFFNLEKEMNNPKLEHISINRVKIRKAINNLKNGATPGPDGVTVDILKQFYD